MIQIVPSNGRFNFRNEWLDARWHFSFGHYMDERNLGFGPLRVFNDDVVQANSGFPMHRHDEMEIITYVIEGELTHSDSTGGSGVIRAGELQRMTAGRGIRHSEFNKSNQPVHLLQIWIEPATPLLEPGYEQKPVAITPGEFGRVVSGTAGDGALVMHQDATIYVGKFSAGQKAKQTVAAGRRAYLFVIEGDVVLNGEKLAKGDQARVTDETTLELQIESDAHLLLIDLP